jgi:hypothetical protein
MPPPDIDPKTMPQEVPNPSHRHGTPSGRPSAIMEYVMILKKLEKGPGLSWTSMFWLVVAI